MSGVVVVDTNILVRAILSRKGQEDAIIRKIGEEDWRLIYGKKQQEELMRVLNYNRISRKYEIDIEVIGEMLEWMAEFGREVQPMEIELCRDKEDNYLLGVAARMTKSGRVYLITGDKDLLVLKGKVERVEIIKPGEFLKA